MLNLAQVIRIKVSIWIRQLYVPGVRGAAVILLINLIIILTIRIATRRMARLAVEQSKTLAAPRQRRLAYATVQK